MPSELREERDKIGTKAINPSYSVEELRKLNERHNIHVAVRGKVYDVSSFVDHHPGGVQQILYGAGRDITQIFESYHPFSAYRVLEKYHIGELVNNEHPVFPEPGPFYRTVKERVAKYFKENNVDPKIDYWMFLRYIVFILTTVACWIGMIYFQDNWPMAILSSMGYGFFLALISISCGHDASHFCVTHKPWVWDLVGCAHDFFQGQSMFIWTYQHVMGHHVYTNIDGHDPDIMTAAPELPDIRRIKENQYWLSYYFYQHLYCPLLYCFLGVKSRLQDFVILNRMTNGAIKLNKPTTFMYVRFYGGKLTHILYRFIIPLYFMPIWKMLIFNVVAEMIIGSWLAFVFQTSHVISEVEWPQPDSNNVFHQDWAELQVASTMDFATESWFWTVFTGAINHQTTHHLLPWVIQSHYQKITPIIKQACEEFGVRYNCVNTAWEAVFLHLQHLKRFGQLLTNRDDDKNK